MKRTVRLMMASEEKLIIHNNLLLGRKPEIVISDYPDDGYPTLRDISIILYAMSGQGVSWQLSEELSKRLNVDPSEISDALLEIIKEYSMITEEEGFERFNNMRFKPKYYE